MLRVQVLTEIGLGCFAAGLVALTLRPDLRRRPRVRAWGLIFGAQALVSFATAWGGANGWSEPLALSVLLARGLAIPALLMAGVSRDLLGSDWRFGPTARRAGLVSIGAAIIVGASSTAVQEAMTLAGGNPSISPATDAGIAMLGLMSAAWGYVVAGYFFEAHQLRDLPEFAEKRILLLVIAWAFLLAGILGGAVVVLENRGEFTLMQGGLLVAHALNIVPIGLILLRLVRRQEVVPPAAD